MICLPAAKFLFRPQSVAAWSPTALPLYGWYKADAGVPVSTDGASVASWADQSGNGNNLAQATTANQGVFRTAANGVNGIPVLEFAASLSTPRSIRDTSFVGSDSDGFSFYVVSQNLSTRLQYGGSFMIGADGAGSINQFCDNPLNYVNVRNQYGAGDWGIFGHRSDYTATKVSCGASYDSVKCKTTYTNQQTQPGVGNIALGTGFRLGMNYYGSVGSRIAEVIVCNRELTTTEEASLDAYFRSRYGFGLFHTLPVTGAALWLDASRTDTLFAESTLATAVTADNGPVGGWKDLSGNTRNALQATSTNRPTWRTPNNGQNGLGVLSFNGSSQWLDISSLPALDTGYTFYGVFKQPTASGYVFCVPGAGTANSTAAITAQPSATVTAIGNAQISTAQSAFSGGSSALFDGTGDYLDVSGTGAATAFGTGDFTIEFWCYLLAVNVQQNLVDKIGSASNAIYATSAGVLKYYVGADRITGSTLSASTWYHIALVRYAGTTKLYVNGVQSGSSYADANNYALNTGSPRIGAAFNSTASVNGYLDDLRIAKFAAYTSAFTPSSAPHPDDGSASLMLHMDGTNGSTTFTDSSSRAGLTQGNVDVSSPAPVAAPVGFIGNYDGSHTTGSYSVRTSLGTSYTTGTMTQATGTPATGAATVGRGTGTVTQYFNSSLYELVVLPRQSTTTEDTAWKAYAAAKWGITWS